jgi:hypothetical protein
MSSAVVVYLKMEGVGCDLRDLVSRLAFAAHLVSPHPSNGIILNLRFGFSCGGLVAKLDYASTVEDANAFFGCRKPRRSCCGALSKLANCRRPTGPVTYWAGSRASEEICPLTKAPPLTVTLRVLPEVRHEASPKRDEWGGII